MNNSIRYTNFLILLFVLFSCTGEDLINDRVDPELRVLRSVNEIFLGQTAQLSVRYFNIVGAGVENPNLKWESSDTSILVVNADGTIEPKSTGDVSVTVSVITEEGQTLNQTFSIKVLSNVDTSTPTITPVLTLISENETVIAGSGPYLEYTFVDSKTGEDLRPDSIDWESSDDSLISIDEQGKLTVSQKSGTATVTLLIDYDGETYRQSIDLQIIFDPKLNVSSDKNTVEQGSNISITVIFTNQEGNEVDELEYTFKSLNTDVLTVDENGNVLGISPGETEVEVSVTFGDKEFTENLSIIITEKSPTHDPELQLLEIIESIEEGDTHSFGFSFTDDFGENNDDVDIEWVSSNSDIIEIGSDGTITAKAVGETTIEVRVTFKEVTYLQQTKVSVTQKLVEPILSFNDPILSIQKGEENQLTIKFTDDLGQEVDDIDVDWKTSDEQILRVDGAGNITAIDTGEVTVTVSTIFKGNTYTQEIGLTVVAIPPEPVLSLTQTIERLEEGTTHQLGFSLIDENSGDKLNPTSVSWSSSENSVVEVDSDGTLNALSPGDAEITLTVTYDGDEFSENSFVNVWILPEISITNEVSRLKRNQTHSFTVEYRNDQGEVTSPPDLTWSTNSSDNIISLDSDGTITGKNPGKTRVFVSTTYNNESIDSYVEVTVFVDPEVTITNKVAELRRNRSSTIEFVFIDEAGNEDTSVSAVWTSSDPSIVSVNDDGRITANEIGRAEITVTIAVGQTEYQDSFNINVVVTPIVRITNSISGLVEGTTHDFDIEFKNELDQVINPSSVSWTSSSPSILSVDLDGIITAESEGSSTITVAVVYDGTTYEREIDITVMPNTSSSDDTPEVLTGTFESSTFYTLEGSYTIEADGDDLIVSFGSDYKADTRLPGYGIFLSNSSSSVSEDVAIPVVIRPDIFKGEVSYTVENVGIRDYNHLLFWCIPFSVKVGGVKLF